MLSDKTIDIQESAINTDTNNMQGFDQHEACAKGHTPFFVIIIGKATTRILLVDCQSLFNTILWSDSAIPIEVVAFVKSIIVSSTLGKSNEGTQQLVGSGLGKVKYKGK